MNNFEKYISSFTNDYKHREALINEGMAVRKPVSDIRKMCRTGENFR